MKYRERIQHWPTPITRAEVEAFLGLTLFLSIFIPGRAQHAIIIKQSYLEEVGVELLWPCLKNLCAKMGRKSGIHLGTGITEVV